MPLSLGVSPTGVAFAQMRFTLKIGSLTGCDSSASPAPTASHVNFRDSTVDSKIIVSFQESCSEINK